MPACTGLLHNKNLPVDFIWVWRTFLKHSLYARYYSELSGFASQGWLSMIFPFWLSVGSYKVCWNKNESDNVSSDCRREKGRWSRMQARPRCRGCPSFLTPAHTPCYPPFSSAHSMSSCVHPALHRPPSWHGFDGKFRQVPLTTSEIIHFLRFC